MAGCSAALWYCASVTTASAGTATTDRNSARGVIVNYRCRDASTRHALMVVLRAHAFEQLDRLRERADALNRAVGHVHRRLALAVDLLYVGAFRDEIENHLVIAACRGVVDRGVAVVVLGVDVQADFFDEELHRRQHAGRRMMMVVGGEAFPVALAGGGEQRRDRGA